MTWEKRKRDHNVLFAVNYEDGRTAYMTVSPKRLEVGEHLVRLIARERQESGEIPDGVIRAVKKVR